MLFLMPDDNQVAVITPQDNARAFDLWKRPNVSRSKQKLPAHKSRFNTVPLDSLAAAENSSSISARLGSAVRWRSSVSCIAIW
jgi:hypothetical protein